MSEDAFQRRRQGFEEEFFKRKNEDLRRKLKEAFDKESAREDLRHLTGITDESVIDTLLAMSVSRETLAAFALLPLVEVAWADGSLDEPEQSAILAAAAEHGIAPGSTGHAALGDLLRRAPDEAARKAWHAWVAEMGKKLAPTDRRRVREDLLRRARVVAEASGGILGMAPISAKEQAVLDAIAAALPD